MTIPLSRLQARLFFLCVVIALAAGTALGRLEAIALGRPHEASPQYTSALSVKGRVHYVEPREAMLYRTSEAVFWTSLAVAFTVAGFAADRQRRERVR